MTGDGDEVPHLGYRKGRKGSAKGYPDPIEGRCNAAVDGKNGVRRRCKSRAGWGTDTPGYGMCRTHGGTAPNARASATAAMYADRFAGRIRFGQVLEVDPRLGLLAEFHRTNGFVAYLQQEIAATAGEDGRPALTRTAVTQAGEREDVVPLVKVWQWERKHLAAVAKMLEDIGFNDAQLDLFAAYQEHVIDVIEGVVRDLGHDPHAPAVAAAVGRRLELVAGGLSAP